MENFLWGILPYIAIVSFFAVPVIRMVVKPFSWTTRATTLFDPTGLLGWASLLMHWGLLAAFLGHLVGLIGGVVGSSGSVVFFYWLGLVGGLAAIAGSALALIRRISNPEVRALSMVEDYLIHVFLIVIMGLALYQVIAHQIFGIAYTASSWFASLWSLNPQASLMASASAITKTHVFLALVFFAYFPFTKLVHVWTLPVNFFARPRQAVRTLKYRYQTRWEWRLMNDKSWMVYALAVFAVIFLVAGGLLGSATPAPASVPGEKVRTVEAPKGRLAGTPLYVSQCARCHGVDGSGDGAMFAEHSPLFMSSPRNFQAANYRFVSTKNGVAADQDLAKTVREGLPAAGMPAFDNLTEEQIESLTAVLRRFAGEAAAEPGESIDVPPATVLAGASPQEGRKIYQQQCASCHGQSGRGNGPAADTITDWQGQSVQPRDLTAEDQYKRGTEANELYARIAAGIPGGSGGGYLMPPFHQSLDQDQIAAIVRYIRTDLIPAD